MNRGTLDRQRQTQTRGRTPDTRLVPAHRKSGETPTPVCVHWRTVNRELRGCEPVRVLEEL